MTEFDEDGFAIPGTYPISTVHLGMWGEGGTPIPTVESAVCDHCGGWASNVWFAARTTCATDSLTDVRISRRVTVTAYACPEHSDGIMSALVDEHGSAVNAFSVDELAQKVDQSQRP